MLVMALQLLSNDVIAEDQAPRFMTPYKHSGATEQQKMAYSKGALESLIFGLYSRVDRSLSSYQHLVDCYKEEFESINMVSELPWVYGENLNESLAQRSLRVLNI